MNTKKYLYTIYTLNILNKSKVNEYERKNNPYFIRLKK